MFAHSFSQKSQVPFKVWEGGLWTMFSFSGVELLGQSLIILTIHDTYPAYTHLTNLPTKTDNQTYLYICIVCPMSMLVCHPISALHVQSPHIPCSAAGGIFNFSRLCCRCHLDQLCPSIWKSPSTLEAAIWM